ncbi:unnamed protein product [Ambrosiozyma monospora]|uniref:Unnamed protein product n=1 Tax=Ambrosiozyma monospora TaxID=43982 RepID=A0A9W7DJX5_AMBMO|nr:unnamed protein product [Ambrosiozyma monospora]
MEEKDTDLLYALLGGTATERYEITQVAPQAFTQLASFKISYPSYSPFDIKSQVQELLKPINAEIIHTIMPKHQQDSLISLSTSKSIMYAVFDLKGRIAPKKRQSVVHGGDKYDFIMELQSKLKHCYYCGSTNHTRSQCIADPKCTHCGHKHTYLHCPDVPLERRVQLFSNSPQLFKQRYVERTKSPPSFVMNLMKTSSNSSSSKSRKRRKNAPRVPSVSNEEFARNSQMMVNNLLNIDSHHDQGPIETDLPREEGDEVPTPMEVT